MLKDPETWRLKALAAERMANDVLDPELKKQWAEIAIEWHLLASIGGTLRSSPTEPTDLDE